MAKEEAKVETPKEEKPAFDGNLQINVSSTKKDGQFTVTYPVGKTLADAVEKFGEDDVFSRFCAALTVTVQGVTRNWWVKGKTPEEIQKMLETWKPGIISMIARDPKASIIANFGKLSEKERAEILAELKNEG